MLTDDFGREVTDIRISLTDRCNFDCVYCHNEGLGDTRGPMDPTDDEMSTDEVIRILDVLSGFDIEAVKFTGGEPLLRQDLEQIVAATPDSMEPSVTTNGSLLPDRAQDLADAGLERVNISQDAIDPETFAEVTKSGAFSRVLDGVEAALAADLTPIKLDMVVFDKTVEQIPDLIDYAEQYDGIRLQLIEYMPEIAGNPDWAVDIDDVHQQLASIADTTATREMHHRQQYIIGDSLVEIVDPVENPEFCANCHRVRITPDGSMKGCLNRSDDIRSLDDMTRDEIKETFKKTVQNRVPYYGEYLIETEDGEWVQNPEYNKEEIPPSQL